MDGEQALSTRLRPPVVRGAQTETSSADCARSREKSPTELPCDVRLHRGEIVQRDDGSDVTHVPLERLPARLRCGR